MYSLAIISDIHGCLPALDAALAQVAAIRPDYYLILGDVLNHGPRNPVPDGYAPAEVAERLNSLRERVIAVRGNCDSEVDQMLLKFPCLAPHNQLLLDGRRWFMTHGHLYQPEQLPLAAGDVLISGHTHVTVAEADQAGVYHVNPGSITFPRNGAVPSCAVYVDQQLKIIDIHQGQVLHQLDLSL